MRLSELKAVHLAVCFWLFHAQAFHEPAVLLCRKLTGFFAVSWPLIGASYFIQSAIWIYRCSSNAIVRSSFQMYRNTYSGSSRFAA